jgi:hypothetical protein
VSVHVEICILLEQSGSEAADRKKLTEHTTFLNLLDSFFN